MNLEKSGETGESKNFKSLILPNLGNHFTPSPFVRPESVSGSKPGETAWQLEAFHAGGAVTL